MPSREDQLEFFTQAFDDKGEEDEKRTSAMKASIKMHEQRKQSTASTSAAGDQPAESEPVVSILRCGSYDIRLLKFFHSFHVKIILCVVSFCLTACQKISLF